MIDVSYTETPQSCSNICQSIQECLWFTHDSATKGCYSLKDCIPVLDCPTCVSGEVNCPYEKGIHQDQFPLLSRFLPFSVLSQYVLFVFPVLSSRDSHKFLKSGLKFVQPFFKAVVLLSRTGKASNSHFERVFFTANLDKYNQILIFTFFQVLCD